VVTTHRAPPSGASQLMKKDAAVTRVALRAT
jgi:hypothetical protein